MKIGDKIEVRNVGGTEWASAEVTAVRKDDMIQAKVDHPGHEFDGKTLIFDADHYRAPEKKT
jgi:hypothetical protein